MNSLKRMTSLLNVRTICRKAELVTPSIGARQTIGRLTSDQLMALLGEGLFIIKVLIVCSAETDLK